MMGHPAFDLDWNLVRTFVAVAKAGSLAAGARRLGISHPTAARHIQQLEDSIGVALFSRTGQGLVLNEAGQGLSNAAAVMHSSALAFQAASDSVRARPVERVRVSVAQILGDGCSRVRPEGNRSAGGLSGGLLQRAAGCPHLDA